MSIGLREPPRQELLIGTGTRPPLERLAEFYGHLGDLARGYGRSADQREEQVRIVRGWRADVERLIDLVGTGEQVPGVARPIVAPRASAPAGGLPAGGPIDPGGGSGDRLGPGR